jgi:hypothetical protein
VPSVAATSVVPSVAVVLSVAATVAVEAAVAVGTFAVAAEAQLEGVAVVPIEAAAVEKAAVAARQTVFGCTAHFPEIIFTLKFLRMHLSLIILIAHTL